MRTPFTIVLTAMFVAAGRVHADTFVFSLQMSSVQGTLSSTPFSGPMTITLTGQAVPIDGSGVNSAVIVYLASSTTVSIPGRGTFASTGAPTAVWVRRTNGHIELQYRTTWPYRMLVVSESGFPQLVNWNGFQDFGPLTGPAGISGWFVGTNSFTTTGGVVLMNDASGIPTTFNLTVNGIPTPPSALALAVGSVLLGARRRRARC